MPLRAPPKCIQCEKSESTFWRNVEIGEICNECYEQNRENLKSELEPDDGGESEKKLRKSTRSTRFKSKNSSSVSRSIPKGKSRRNIFKKNPSYKSPTVTATITTSDTVFYKGQYYQIGDVVSLVDRDGDTFYAQIRGLMTDAYCEKSAFLTWLIPTTSSPEPNERFDPASYLIGPEEDLARKLSCMEFVMSAPSNYYHDKTTPYPVPDVYDKTAMAGSGFIWKNMIN